MRIDSIQERPDRAGRYGVKLADGMVLRLYRQTIEDFSLYPGLELTQERMDALRESAGAYSAKMRAVRIVSASSVSAKTLQRRLIDKGEDPTQAQAAVAWMEELHLVDDRQTAAQIVSGCIAKGYGIRRARQVLYEKQIPKDIWDEVLEDYPDQTEYIEKYLRTKLPPNADPKLCKRAIDGLIRRGHSYSAIRRAMERMGADAEEFQEEETWR